MNLLHFDVEGGWGGSSRSLFEIVKKLKSTRNKSTIICRRVGPIQKKYKKINIEYHIEKRLYSFIPRKNGKNFKNFIGSLYQLIFFPLGIFSVLKIIKKNKIDLLHINYEGFFLLAFFLKIITKKPIIFHIRTQFPDKNIFCRFLVFLIMNYIADYIFFITDLEKKSFLHYKTNSKVPKKVLFNISSFKSSRIKLTNIISYFGNISYEKGVDRILEIAKICNQKKINYKFLIFGKLDNTKYIINLKKKITEYHLKNFYLMGHVSNPEKYLVKSFLLLRLSRSNDPYGRDVIEALTLGVPTLATGSYQGIIKNNYNGYLIKKFSYQKIIYLLEFFKKNRALRNKLSNNCIKRKHLFDGTDQLKKFERAINLIRTNYNKQNKQI